MENKERITHEAGNEEAWICVCNNTPTDHGFYPCDTDGNEVEPTREAWKIPLYVCAKCGRIIDMHTLEVVARTKASDRPSITLMNKRLPSNPIAYAAMEEKYNNEHVFNRQTLPDNN
jgi:hypothetical protein